MGLAGVLALGSNHRRGMPILPGQTVAYGTAFLTVPQARAYLEHGAVAVDARSPLEFRNGHLPQAVQDWHGQPRDTLLIVYGRDRESEQTAPVVQSLLAEGYSRVTLMPEGWNGWQK